MREYIRMDAPGGAFFFTLVTFRRAPILTLPGHIVRLRAAFEAAQRRRPFEIQAAVILPDHLHTLVELPPGDGDYSKRLSQVKSEFSRVVEKRAIGEPPASASRRRRRERSVWQRRFWEHTIRDDADFSNHMDYIHYNPVKHGYVRCPHDWPYSSFHRWVRAGRYDADWACSCRRPAAPPPGAVVAEGTVGE